MNILQPLEDALAVFLSYIPQLIGAIIILIVGYIIAKVLQAIVTRVLRSVGFENWMERGGVVGLGSVKELFYAASLHPPIEAYTP